MAVVRTSGAGSVDALAPLFSAPRRLRSAAGHTLHRGVLRDPATHDPIDEVVVAVYRAPSSYTGEESVEVFCHGSPAGLSRILDALGRTGFRRADRGEFTLRAFLHGKLDLTRAEAVQEIVAAKSVRAQQLALARLGGGVQRRIAAAKDALVEMLAAMEVQLDYPEDEVADVPVDTQRLQRIAGDLQSLADTYETGRIYRDGFRVALAGRTNAGKSSLFNLFLKEDRAIVSDVHGTTRDYLEAWVSVRGVPVRLYDTAGLRTAGDPVEAEGVRRTQRVVEHAHLVLYLVDAAAGLTAEDEEYLDAHGRNAATVAVWNKADVTDRPPPREMLRASAVTGEGFADLEETIVARSVGASGHGGGDVVIDSQRQKELLDRCVAAVGEVVAGAAAGAAVDLLAGDLHEAVNALAEITGEVTSADVLETMFSRFCVGK